MANPITAITPATMGTNLAASTISATAEPGFWTGQVVYRKADFDATQALPDAAPGVPGQPRFALYMIGVRMINVATVTNLANKAGAAATCVGQDDATTPWKAIIQRLSAADTLVGPAFEVHVDDLYTLTTLQAAFTGLPISTWTDQALSVPLITYTTPIPGITFVS